MAWEALKQLSQPRGSVSVLWPSLQNVIAREAPCRTRDFSQVRLEGGLESGPEQPRTDTARALHSFLSMRGPQTSSVKGHVVNILGFVGRVDPVATTQLCLCSMNVALYVIQANRCGGVPIKLYLHQQATG